MSTSREHCRGWLIGISVFGLFSGFAAAQDKGPGSAAAASPAASQPTAQSEAGEPRVTVPPPAAAREPPDAASRSATVEAAARSPSAIRASRPGSAKGAGAADRLDLNTATVTGDREQPKVLYIVPWKSADIGDVSGKPMNSLLDEALAPVDRDEFKREVVYYNAVAADAAKSAASRPGTPQGEK